MDVIFKFHKCGFEVCGVVCDGASSNMTMVKELAGSTRKAYGFVYKNEIINNGIIIYLCIGLNVMVEPTLKSKDGFITLLEKYTLLYVQVIRLIRYCTCILFLISLW